MHQFPLVCCPASGVDALFSDDDCGDAYDDGGFFEGGMIPCSAVHIYSNNAFQIKSIDKILY